MYTKCSKQLQQAYEQSSEKVLEPTFGLVTSRHGQKHTAALYLRNYMKEGRIKQNDNLLVACYLADGNVYESQKEDNYPVESLKLAQLALDLEKDHVELSVRSIKPLTDEELIFALIHLWMNIIFLDGESEEPAVQYFIDQRTRNTRNVINFLYLYKLGEKVHPLIIELSNEIERDTLHMTHRF